MGEITYKMKINLTRQAREKQPERVENSKQVYFTAI